MAPERISLALALPSLTSTTNGAWVRARPLARFTSLTPSRVELETITPSSSHCLAISTLAISKPPGLLRRSSTKPLTPSPLSSVMALRMSLAALALNCFRRM